MRSHFFVGAAVAPHLRRHALADVLDPLLDIDLELLNSHLHPGERVQKKQRREFLQHMDTRVQAAQSRLVEWRRQARSRRDTRFRLFA